MQIFMCFAQTDYEDAKAIHSLLSQAGHRVYRSGSAAKPDEALMACDAFLYLLSDESSNDPNCRHAYTLARQYRRRIIVAVLDEGLPELPADNLFDLPTQGLPSLLHVIAGFSEREQLHQQQYIDASYQWLSSMATASNLAHPTQGRRVCGQIADFFEQYPTYRDKNRLRAKCRRWHKAHADGVQPGAGTSIAAFSQITLVRSAGIAALCVFLIGVGVWLLTNTPRRSVGGLSNRSTAADAAETSTPATGDLICVRNGTVDTVGVVEQPIQIEAYWDGFPMEKQSYILEPYEVAPAFYWPYETVESESPMLIVGWVSDGTRTNTSIKGQPAPGAVCEAEFGNWVSVYRAEDDFVYFQDLTP